MANFRRKFYWYQCTACREVFYSDLNFYDEYGFFEKDKGPLCLPCRNKPSWGITVWPPRSKPDIDDE